MQGLGPLLSRALLRGLLRKVNAARAVFAKLIVTTSAFLNRAFAVAEKKFSTFFHRNKSRAIHSARIRWTFCPAFALRGTHVGNTLVFTACAESPLVLKTPMGGVVPIIRVNRIGILIAIYSVPFVYPPGRMRPFVFRRVANSFGVNYRSTRMREFPRSRPAVFLTFHRAIE